MNQKELFLISVTIFLTVVAWMLFEIYKVDTAIKMGKENLSVVSKKIEIDQEILKILKTKEATP